MTSAEACIFRGAPCSLLQRKHGGKREILCLLTLSICQLRYKHTFHKSFFPDTAGKDFRLGCLKNCSSYSVKFILDGWHRQLNSCGSKANHSWLFISTSSKSLPLSKNLKSRFWLRTRRKLKRYSTSFSAKDITQTYEKLALSRTSRTSLRAEDVLRVKAVVSPLQAVITEGFIRELCLSGVVPQVICSFLSLPWVTAPSPCQSVSVSSAPNQQIPAPSCKSPMAGRDFALLSHLFKQPSTMSKGPVYFALWICITYSTYICQRKAFYPMQNHYYHAQWVPSAMHFTFFMVTPCTCTLLIGTVLNLVPLSATCFLNISVDNDNFPPSPPLSAASLTYLGALPVLTLICVSLKMHSVD